MTEQEICDRQRENGNSEMYLMLRGHFWRAYDGGAFALARITGYQVRRLKTVERYVLGFPLAALVRVLALMAESGLVAGPYEEGAEVIAFSGGDPSPEGSLMSTDGGSDPADDQADYLELKSLRKELLSINLADSTPQEAMYFLRSLQIRCLAHMRLS